MFYPCSLYGEVRLPHRPLVTRLHPGLSHSHSCEYTWNHHRPSLQTTSHHTAPVPIIRNDPYRMQKSHHHLNPPLNSTRHAKIPPLSLRPSRSPSSPLLRLSFVHRNQPIEGTLTSGGKVVVVVVVAESIRCDC
jgi:hypothetical protein